MSTKNSRKHVFISHHHVDDAQVDNMTSLLSRSGHDIRNSSIRTGLKPENQRKLDQGRVKDATIRRLLRRKICWAGTVVVLIGKDTYSRSWVDWEIKEAEKQNKRIVGVYVRGGTESDVPAALEDYAASIVGWNSESIIGAIDGTENLFEKPDGALRPIMHRSATSNC